MKVIVCRCEDTTLDDLRHAVEEGYRDLEEVKRYTGFGTGLCQGKECLATVAQELCRLTATPAHKVSPFTSRPPLAPTPIRLLSTPAPSDRQLAAPVRTPQVKSLEAVAPSSGTSTGTTTTPQIANTGGAEGAQSAGSIAAATTEGLGDKAQAQASPEHRKAGNEDPPPTELDHGRPTAGSLPATADVVIVGAGIVGLAIAYQLTQRGLRDIVVVDKGYLAEGASGRNGGGVRQQWSTELNIRLMRQSVEMFRQFSVEMGVNVWFRQGGYLFLARNAAELARLERNVALHNRCGVPTRLLDAAEAEKIVPHLNVTGIAGAAYNASDGIVFPWPFLWGYAKAIRQRGVAVFTHTPVIGIERDPHGLRVVTSRGSVLGRRVINAAGAWSPSITRMLGIELPTWPIRHEICSSEPLKPFLGPMVSELASGLYCSQSMRGEIVGGITVPEHETSHVTASSLRFLELYAQGLRRLMPILGNVKILRQWAGPYDASPDGNPILGAPAAEPNLFLACGFVGHGFMMAPVLGSLYADLLTGGPRHEIFDRFPLERFRDGGSPRHEREDFNIG